MTNKGELNKKGYDNMIHYGKTPQGDLEIIASPNEVGELYGLLESAGLLQRRTFNGLKEYIRREFAEELEHHCRRMTAQIPVKEGGESHASM